MECQKRTLAGVRLKKTATTLLILGMGVYAIEGKTTQKSKPTPKSTAANHKAFEIPYEDVQSKLVIIEADDSTGSGFIVKMGELYYILTNQHVILGAKSITFKTASGISLQPKKIEFSNTRDIARLLIESDSGFELASGIKMDDSVVVIGNSQGAGVITELFGKVDGVGPDVIEVSSEFVEGNSGSPVLNKELKVCGIATYVKSYGETKVSKGTKWENISRRFAHRLEGSEWIPINWKVYNQTYGVKLKESDEFRFKLYGFVNDWMDQPAQKIFVNDTENLELERWSKQHNNMVNRIARMRDRGEATTDELHNTNKMIRKDLLDSTESLVDICTKKARYLKFMATRKDVTKHLQDEFERRANELSEATNYIQAYGRVVASTSWFKFIPTPTPTTSTY